MLRFAGDAPVDAEALGRMSASLVHRGPDDDGTVLDGPAGLAARRLAIIDLERGGQPVRSEDGEVVAVQNGEILNHRELREDLRRRGHTFRSEGDTEVLVHLYEEFGLDFAERLRGMFAVAIWDRRRRRLVLARDRFGIKPLFWGRWDGLLAFGSQLRAVELAPGCPRDLDHEAIVGYLAYNAVIGPRTVRRAVRKLLPGHLLVAEDGEVALRRFARPVPAARGALRRERFDALAAELRERLRESVRAHLLADVPVGVLLSGGIDSGALTALAAGEVHGRLRTFSVGFTERSFDETGDARLVARRYDTDHHEVVLRPPDATVLPDLVAAFDEPFADSSMLPTDAVCGLAASHVKVVLSGEGGDELFGGYETYAADVLAPWLRASALLAPLVERLPSAETRMSLDLRAKRFVRAVALPPLERHHGWKEIFGAEDRRRLLGPAADGTDPLDVARARWAETAGAPLLARLQDVDTGVPLVDDLLVKTDRMSMRHSLEARVPFLDPGVAGLALALPTRTKVAGTAKKRLLRAAVAPLLPEEIVRGRKRGFSIPAAAWLRRELRPLVDEALGPAAVRRHGVLDPATVADVVERHGSGREDLSRQLWGLLCLQLWLEAGGASGPPGAAGPGDASAGWETLAA